VNEYVELFSLLLLKEKGVLGRKDNNSTVFIYPVVTISAISGLTVPICNSDHEASPGKFSNAPSKKYKVPKIKLCYGGLTVCNSPFKMNRIL
jgi:hypothetical protein